MFSKIMQLQHISSALLIHRQCLQEVQLLISVVAGGIPNVFTYQWYRNGVAITGETGSTLTISSISTTDVGIYSCTPTNSGGTTNSSSTTISVTSKHNGS